MTQTATETVTKAVTETVTKTATETGRCSDRELCFDGNDAVEPFVAIHNMLRAHAMVGPYPNTIITLITLTLTKSNQI